MRKKTASVYFPGDWNEHVVSLWGGRCGCGFWCFALLHRSLCRNFDQMSIQTEDFTMSDDWSTVASECTSVISLNLSPSEPVSPTRRHRKVHVRPDTVLFTTVNHRLPHHIIPFQFIRLCLHYDLVHFYFLTFVDKWLTSGVNFRRMMPKRRNIWSGLQPGHINSVNGHEACVKLATWPEVRWNWE